jgi:hypothetical protein
VDSNFARGIAQNLFESFVEPEQAGGRIQASFGGKARVGFIVYTNVGKSVSEHGTIMPYLRHAARSRGW